MRDTKFRFYSNDAKQYLPIEYIDIQGDFFTVKYLGQMHHIDGINQLEQYTGLKDNTQWKDLTEKEREEWTRNDNMPSEWKGKEIYEGDITAEHRIFHYQDGCIGLIILGDFYSMSELNSMPIYLKIIGNIHENKDLLK